MKQEHIKLEYGVIDLSGLYGFTTTIELPHRTKNEKNFGEYRNSYLELIENVPGKPENAKKSKEKYPGWYIWYDKQKKSVIYVGQATNLYERLKDELEKEYVIFWMKSSEDKETVEKMKELYKQSYNANIERSAKKFGTDTILWIGGKGITGGELDVVEMKLINKFKEPIGNTDIKDYSKIELDLFNEVEQILDIQLRNKGYKME